MAVHAAAVSVAGRGLVLPGRTRAGKTTLLMALLECGAELLSDDLAFLDARGRVHPHPRPALVRGTPRERHPARTSRWRRSPLWCTRPAPCWWWTR